MMLPWKGVLTHTIFITAQPTYIALRHYSNPDYFRVTSAAWLAVTAFTWIWMVTQWSVPFFTSPLRHLPTGPGDRFPIGHFRLERRPPTEELEKLYNTVPNDGIIVLYGLLYRTRTLFLTRPDALMDMMNTHNYDWEKPVLAKKLLAGVLGDGLINVEGNMHKAMRKVVTPAFSGKHIRDLVPLFYSKGLDFADSMAREARHTADGALEMMHQMSRVTLDIIGAAGVGKDFNTIENDDDPLAKLYATITDTNRGPILIFFLINVLLPRDFTRHFTSTVYGRVAAAQLQLRKDVRKLMQEKKKTMEEKPGAQKDIIATIMRSGEYSDDYLVDQLLTFLAAGHDTTASALTWTTWLLSLNPEMQDRLRAECKAHLGNKPPSSIEASDFDPETLPYLSAVCNETLRLYPTVPATARHAVRDTVINNTPIPKGTFAVIAPWAVNRLKSLWGPDADKYNPDRWLQGTNALNGGAQSPQALITFLHGPRSCIGQNFARTEMRCLLAALILRFRFEIADPDEKIEVGGFVTIKPQNGLRLILHDLKKGAVVERKE